MRSFSDHIKNRIDLVPVLRDVGVPPCDIKAQYNPDRFKKWSKQVKGKDTLNMQNSPHVALLKAYEDQGNRAVYMFEDKNYYNMHRSYGKTHAWTMDKIEAFVGLYNHIKEGGTTDRPIILREPVISNKYNKGYEIYEGHHRVACYVALGLPSIPVDLYDIKTKKD